MNSKGELNILKVCGISEKYDPKQKTMMPSKAAMDSFTEERLDVLMMFLDQFQDDVSTQLKN